MKLLIVEDQSQLSENVEKYLQNEGFVCEIAEDYQSALERLSSFRFDIIVLDIMLPDGNGLDILRIVKSNYPATCVLIISAKNALDDRLMGLDLGADDYLAKPFHLAELNARLKAIDRRKNREGKDEIICNEIKLNTNTHEVLVNDLLLDFTRKEFELLQYFITNSNRLLTKQSIAEHLWGEYMDATDSFEFVYQHIKNLRRKIARAGGQDYITTIYGLGYKFKSQ